MKFDDLRSIAHNIANSLASGIGRPIGVYEMDVFGEARRSPKGFITVDFSSGTSAGGKPQNNSGLSQGLADQFTRRLNGPQTRCAQRSIAGMVKAV